MELVRQKNAATYIVFPLVDDTGSLVTGASGLDSEIDTWADGSAPNGFTDCTNEATEIGSTGQYYLSLTQSEMNNDYIVVQIKSSSALTQTLLIRTTVGDPLNFATTADGGAINVATGIVEAQVKSIDANAINASSIASDAITAAKLASDVATEIQSGLATASALSTVESKVDTIDTNVDSILADTNELQGDWANGGRLDLILDARASQSSVDTIDDLLDTEVAAILADTNELQTDLADGGRLDLLIDAIKAKTDNLPTDPADASDIASSFSTVNSKLDAIDDYVDAEVAAIKAVTDKLDTALELDGAVYRYTTNALEQAPTGGSAPTVEQIADAVWDEPLADHSGIAGSTAEALDGAGGGASPTAVANAVWNERIDDHLNDRSFGAHVAIHLPAVGPDIDYKRISEITDKAVDKIVIPQPFMPEKFDYETLAKGFESVLSKIDGINLPETDLRPIMSQLEGLEREIKAIEIPITDLSETNSLINSKNDVLDMLSEAQEDIKNGQLDRIREFFESGLDKIQSDIASLKETIDSTQMVVLQDKPKEKKEKPSVLDEYLKL